LLIRTVTPATCWDRCVSIADDPHTEQRVRGIYTIRSGLLAHRGNADASDSDFSLISCCFSTFAVDAMAWAGADGCVIVECRLVAFMADHP